MAQEKVQETGEVKIARAKVRFLRISPRKVRLVVDAIRWQPAGRALALLANLQKKAARMAEKLLKSAVANAKVLGMDETKLYVSKIHADGGPVMKRFMARSMGRADRILKRTTHLVIEVREGRKSYTDGSAAGSAQEVKEGSKQLKARRGAKTKSKNAAAAV